LSTFADALGLLEMAAHARRQPEPDRLRRSLEREEKSLRIPLVAVATRDEMQAG
jgi:hypothetical protein